MRNARLRAVASCVARIVCLTVCAFGVGAGIARASTLAPIMAIPSAQAALDPTGALSFNGARTQLVFHAPQALTLPGTATPYRPTIVWVRFYPPGAGEWYLAASPSVGYADVYYMPRDGAPYAAIRFGMRVPFVERAIPRTFPTLALPRSAAGRALYVRLSLDTEAHAIVPLALIDAAELHASNRLLDTLSSAGLFFVGIFVSLAAANLFVFAFVRERSYALYSGLMLGNALFAATYEHRGAWAFLWPGLSLPDEIVQVSVVLAEGALLLAFARSFLATPRIAPRTDRIVTAIALPLLAVAAVAAYVMPSGSVGLLSAQALMLLALVGFTIAVFVLGIVALRKGSVAARFFAASNGVVSCAAGLTAYFGTMEGTPNLYRDFVVLLTAQAIEGWLLFGALAYRLRRTIRAHEQERSARELEEARALADAGTGIANRRAFDDALAREWARCARIGAPISLLLLDVDHFKKYNDTYGHVLGDACLRAVAAAIASCATRPSDLCARYGGEEFVVLLSETDAGGAAEIADRIVRTVRALGILHSASSLGRVTVSVGTSTALPKPNSVPTLVDEADARLYAAKAAGRDRAISP